MIPTLQRISKIEHMSAALGCSHRRVLEFKNGAEDELEKLKNKRANNPMAKAPSKITTHFMKDRISHRKWQWLQGGEQLAYCGKNPKNPSR